MPGERNRLLTHALHQVAIRCEHVGAVIDQFGAEHGREVALGNRHADGIAQSLSQRTGRCLHARREEVLGMTRGDRAQLAEALDLIDRHLLIDEQMK